MAEAERTVGSIGIKVKPDFSTFGEELRAGLGGFAGAGFGANMAASQARFTQSEQKLSPFTPVGGAPTVAASGGNGDIVTAADQTLATLRSSPQGTAAEMSMMAITAGASRSVRSGSNNLAAKMMFYGGGTTGGWMFRNPQTIPEQINAFSAGSVRADVRTETHQMSGAAEAEIRGVISREAAARQKLVAAIEGAAAVYEQQARSSRLPMTRIPLDAPSSAWFDNSAIFDAAEMEHRAASRPAQRPPRQHGGALLPPSTRMALFQGMFGAWEVQTAAMAATSGNNAAMLATTPGAELQARIQQQQQSWGGIFASMIGLSMDAFGQGPLSFISGAQSALGAYQSQDALRAAMITASGNAGIRAATMGGNDLGAKMAQYRMQERMARNELDPQIRTIRSRLNETEEYMRETEGTATEAGWVGGYEKATRFKVRDFDRIALQNQRDTLQIQLDDQVRNIAMSAAMDRRAAAAAASQQNYNNAAAAASLAGNPLGAARAQAMAQYNPMVSLNQQPWQLTPSFMMNGVGLGDPRFNGMVQGANAAVQLVDQNFSMELQRTRYATLAMQQQQQGLVRDAARSRVRAQYAPDFGANGQIVRFGKLGIGQEGFDETMEAYNTAMTGADRGVDASQARGWGNVAAMWNITNGRGPFEAQRSRIRSQFDAEIMGGSDRSLAEASRDESLKTVDRDERIARAAVNLQLSTDEAVANARLARNRMGAEALGMGGQIMSRAEQLLAQFGENSVFGKESAGKALDVGKLQINAFKQDYLDAFRGTAVDLRMMNVTNRRDQEDPAKVLGDIKGVMDRIESKLNSLT